MIIKVIKLISNIYTNKRKGIEEEKVLDKEKQIRTNNKTNDINNILGNKIRNKINNEIFFKNISFSKVFNILIVSVMFFAILTNNGETNQTENFENVGDTNIPIAKYTRITSPFGYRISPFTGKTTSFHPGIDLGTWEGTLLISIMDGKITNSSFKGGFGYCIEIDVGNNMIIQYGHVHPEYMPRLGASVKKGDVIGRVGPKYVSGSPYRDSTGRTTNGLTTAPHLHFGVRKNGKYIDPLLIVRGFK